MTAIDAEHLAHQREWSRRVFGPGPRTAGVTDHIAKELDEIREARSSSLRINPRFSEWLMGWPDGWVTGIPSISHQASLRIIGNGVVPQQAHAALSALLTVAGEEQG